MKALFLLLVAIYYATAAENNANDDTSIENRIIDGQNAGYGQFPWQVAIYFDEGILCGGALIDKEYVLTAAHCVYGRAAGRVILGALRWNDGNAKSVPISYTVSHPGYKPPSLTDDIGIVKVQTPIQEAANIKIIPLAPQNSYLNNGDYVWVSGYGADRNQGSTNADLKYVLMRAISNQECQQRNGGTIPDGSVCCQGEGKKNICSGDSGGPVVQSINNVWTLVAVVSYNVNGCESEHPGGFSRVSYYLPFINQQTGKN